MSKIAPKQASSQPVNSKFVKNIDPVADDRNWIARIENELHCTAAWQTDWGFLAGGTEHLNIEDATKPYNIDDQIQRVQ